MANITRREFGKRVGTGAAVLAFVASVPSMLVTTACASTKALLNTVISAIQGLLRVAEPNAAWAATLGSVLAVLTDAVTKWEAGGPVATVIEVLNSIMNIVAAIPLTAKYSALIDVLITGIEAVLALFPATAMAEVKVKAIPNPHKGRVNLRKPHWLQTEQGAFRGQWNDTADQIGLPAAKF